MWARIGALNRYAGFGGQGGIRTTEARAPDLQSGPIVHSGTCPCRMHPNVVGRSRRWDSNPQPAVYKTAALPIELRRHAQPSVAAAQSESIGMPRYLVKRR